MIYHVNNRWVFEGVGKKEGILGWVIDRVGWLISTKSVDLVLPAARVAKVYNCRRPRIFVYQIKQFLARAELFLLNQSIFDCMLLFTEFVIITFIFIFIIFCFYFMFIFISSLSHIHLHFYLKFIFFIISNLFLLSSQIHLHLSLKFTFSIISKSSLLSLQIYLHLYLKSTSFITLNPPPLSP